MARDGIVPFDPMWRDNYDWREAFVYAETIRTAFNCDRDPFKMDDVAEVIAADPGENDGPSWIMAGKLKDGRFFVLEAGCDYTGWDCQAGGDAMVADTLPNLIRFAITTEGRKRLKFEEPA